MSLKSKGITKERELIHMFWKTGKWAAVRVAGSGNTQYPSADIIAGNVVRKLVIECKSSKYGRLYLPKEGIIALQEFARIFHAEPWLAIRFNNNPWYFICTNTIETIDKNIVINSKNVILKGLLFEEFIGDTGITMDTHARLRERNF